MTGGGSAGGAAAIEAEVEVELENDSREGTAMIMLLSSFEVRRDASAICAGVNFLGVPPPSDIERAWCLPGVLAMAVVTAGPPSPSSPMSITATSSYSTPGVDCSRRMSMAGERYSNSTFGCSLSPSSTSSTSLESSQIGSIKSLKDRLRRPSPLLFSSIYTRYLSRRDPGTSTMVEFRGILQGERYHKQTVKDVVGKQDRCYSCSSF